MTGLQSANAGWKDYWKADRPSSCVPANAGTANAIAEHWIAELSHLPDASRILDIATGNGILLAHAAAAATRGNRRFVLTGVDLAEIDPPRHLRHVDPALRAATFLGGVAAERLPFPAASFDAVVSQYGLEYARLDAALSEVERVLAPGGYLRWLAHAEGTEVVEQNREQGREVEFLLSPGGPLEAMGRFVERMHTGRDVRHSIALLNAALVGAERFCREHAPAKIVWEVCSELAAVANRWRAYEPADLVRMLHEGAERLCAHKLRIEDLRAAVLTAERESLVRARLCGRAWQEVTIWPLCVGADASSIGLMIRARRTAAAEPCLG